MLYVEPRSCPCNELHKFPWDFMIQTYQLLPDKSLDLVIADKEKKRDFTV